MIKHMEVTMPNKIMVSKLSIILSFLFFTMPAFTNVWVIDDGEKIPRDSTSLRFEQGIENPIWAPGKPIHLFAFRNETVAFQVVIEAEDSNLTSVTVDLDSLVGPNGTIIKNTSSDPTQFVGRYIERFVEHYFYIKRHSGGPWSETLWWGTGAKPPDSTWIGWIPDALIPVEVAPDWSPYPLQIAKGQNGVIWIDITVLKNQPPGLYSGEVIVKNDQDILREFDIELEIEDAELPDWPLKTMYYYEYGELARRFGGSWDANVDEVEKHLWQLFHRHRITPFYSALNVSDVNHLLEKLHGTVYTKAEGYEGPAEGRGDDLLSLGTYGGYEEPDTNDLANVEAIADKLAAENLFSGKDVFVYAKDEDCGSSWGEDWKNLLNSSNNPNIDSIRVGWTCSEEPKDQPVDIVMVGSSDYNPSKAEQAVNAGKKVWIYNGWLPKTGTYVTDIDAVSPRVNGLIQAYYRIPRWFYWETTFWYDWNPGGHGPYDPFIQPETFHNQWDEYGNGDGVLVYPGKQVDQFSEHSIGMNGVIASIRLKNIRRGIQDAGYYQLAHQVDPQKADELVTGLIHPALSYVSKYFPQTWPTVGYRFFAVRDSLKELILRPLGVSKKKTQGANSPRLFELNNAYPNPFNPIVNITYKTAVSQRVEIAVYDVLGCKLQRLVYAKQPAGRYQIKWNASGYASGIYIIRMQTKDFSAVRKITLIK